MIAESNKEIDIRMLPENEVIKELEDHGIKVTYRPIALLPNTLEAVHGIGQPHIYDIEIDIYEALEQVRRRSKIMKDPFS